MLKVDFWQSLRAVIQTSLKELHKAIILDLNLKAVLIDLVNCFILTEY